jgi:Carboxypeptidase regulatory-like domain
MFQFQPSCLKLQLAAACAARMVGGCLHLMRENLTRIAMLAVILCGFASTADAQATATVAGSVRDSQGASVAGATVTLVSEGRGSTFPTTSSNSGDFVLTNVPADTYTVSVTMTGFKKVERSGVLVTSGDRVGVGTLTLQVGDLKETVEVSAEAPLLQTQTGERSYTVSQEAVRNVPITGVFFAQMVALAPGVTSVGGNQDRQVRLDSVNNNSARSNFQLDGVTSVNTGGNQPGINLNFDSVAEVRVLTNAYQAEYGRSSGLQIIGITKSGTNQFHGSVYDFERNSNWNTNSWSNQRNGFAKSVQKGRNWGGTFGGPVGRPGKDNRKLFFFVSEQVQPTTTSGAINLFRVPTALERQGDFSQTTDQNGNLLNLIRDPSANLPCTAANTSGCFQDGGVLGRIPVSKQYPLGLNILKSYPTPNIQGLNFNLRTVAPEVTQTNYQHVFRADYQRHSRRDRAADRFAPSLSRPRRHHRHVAPLLQPIRRYQYFV